MFLFSKQEEYLRRIVRKDVKKVIEGSGDEGTEMFDKLMGCGYGSLMVEAEYGGCNFDALSSMIVISEIAKEDAALAHIAATHNFGFIQPIQQLGTAEQKEKYLKGSSYNRKKGSLAFNEPTGQIKTVAVHDGDYYYISGIKSMITEASNSDYALVYANVEDSQEGTIFIFDLKNTPGIFFGKSDETMGFNTLKISDISFENAKVHKSQILCGEKAGLLCILKSMELMRLTNAAIAYGVAERAYEEAKQHTLSYEVEGSKMCDLQYIKFKLSEIKATLASMELMVFYTAFRYDNDSDDKILYASISKLLVSEQAKEICDECLQMFGGAGYIKGYMVERLYRDVRVLSIVGGTREMMKNSISFSVY